MTESSSSQSYLFEDMPAVREVEPAVVEGLTKEQILANYRSQSGEPFTKSNATFFSMVRKGKSGQILLVDSTRSEVQSFLLSLDLDKKRKEEIE